MFIPVRTFFFLFLIGACATTPTSKNQYQKNETICLANLASYGEKVALVRDEKNVANCRKIQNVESQRCRGADQSTFHINGLKNAAGQLGADTVLVINDKSDQALVKGQAYLCVYPKLVPALESQSSPE